MLGDLDASRDWGYAADYVRAMWLMLQQEEADDYVVASGEAHSVRELVQCAFGHVGLDWEEHVRVDPALQRGTAELRRLVGDPARARTRLGGTGASTLRSSSSSSSTPTSHAYAQRRRNRGRSD